MEGSSLNLPSDHMNLKLQSIYCFGPAKHIFGSAQLGITCQCYGIWDNFYSFIVRIDAFRNTI